MKTYQAELHIHTVLSPCAGIEMIPPLIVQQAIQSGLNLIAITDHNASENVPACHRSRKGRRPDRAARDGTADRRRNPLHLPFDTVEQLQSLQDIVERHLPGIPNNIEFFGEQFIVDETGDFIRRKKNY